MDDGQPSEGDDRRDGSLRVTGGQDGDQIFEAFYRRHERQVLRLAFGVLGDRELALDAAQDAWLRYLVYARAEPPVWSPPLLVTVALNAARDAERRRARSREDLSPDVDPASVRDATEPSSLAEALQLLPPHERDALLLHHAVGLSLRDVGRLLGRRPGAVKSVLSRARTRLRKILMADAPPRSPASAADKGGPTR